MRIKVCGMKNPENIQEVAQLQPDYMGFIFYEKSPRFVGGSIPDIHSTIKKTGVFVNASLQFIQKKVKDFNLQAVQLHGQESPEFCRELKSFDIACLERSRKAQNDILGKKTSSHLVEIIKVFSLKDQFDFQELAPYLPVVDYFLFDTKGKLHGGNGATFNWDVLENYPFEKPFFLSGGIGLEEVEALQSFQQKNLPLYAIDVNSKFETGPGRKNIARLKEFKNKLNL